MQERRRRAARLFAAGKRSQAEIARELCGGPVCSDGFFGFLSGIIARRNRGGGNVKISFIDFQGLWKGRKTALSFSRQSPRGWIACGPGGRPAGALTVDPKGGPESRSA